MAGSEGFSVATAYVDIEPAPRRFTQALRIIAKHYAALADELDAPEPAIELPQDWTAEQIAEFQRLWAEVDAANGEVNTLNRVRRRQDEPHGQDGERGCPGREQSDGMGA